MKKNFLILISLILLLTVVPLPHTQHTYAEESTSHTVQASILNLREGPGLTYPVLKELKKGDHIEKIEQIGDWVQVQSGSTTGWVAAWLIQSAEQSTEAATSKNVVSQVNQLNVRNDASMSANVLTKLSAGDQATFIRQTGEWVQIQFGHVTGWVNVKYVSIIEQENKSATNQETAVEKEPEYFTVNVSAVNIRKKPDLSSKKLGVVTQDKTYKVEDREGNWVKIFYEKGESGWIYVFYGTLSGETKQQNSQTNTSSSTKSADPLGYAQILYDGTNLRAEPNTNAAVVKRVNVGESFEIVQATNDWYEIKVDEKTAYIANWVVQTTKSKLTKQTAQPAKETRKKGTLKGLTIVVDPGHGGNDHGTTGVNNTPEKTVNLLTAELLTSKLQSAGAIVVMTRESDVYVNLRKRVSVSTKHAADAFISIHYDATENNSVRGFTTYYTNSNSKKLANAVHKGLGGKLDLKDRGVQTGNYLVIRDNPQPSLLLELGYLSNRDEERTVNTDYFREQATQGIYNGLIDYFDSLLQ